MLAVAIFFTLSSASAASMRAEATTGDWLKVIGIDLLQQDIEMIKNIRCAENCAEVCAKKSNCESFSYHSSPSSRPNSTCWLKQSVQNYVVNSNVVSYVKTPSTYQCFSYSELPGDVFYHTATSYNDCAKLCDKERANCDGFTWVLNENDDLGLCYLKALPADAKTVANSLGAITCKRKRSHENIKDNEDERFGFWLRYQGIYMLKHDIEIIANVGLQLLMILFPLSIITTASEYRYPRSSQRE
jgi:hypothetical protein